MKWVVLLAFVAVVANVEALRFKHLKSALLKGVKVSRSFNPESDPAPQWFNQTVDHYDPLNTDTFMQLYYVNDTYYKAGGPVFFLLGGESALAPDAVLDHFVLPYYAAQFNALIVAVEHRFYGQSIPYGDLSTDNLALLTSYQALADYALIQEYITEQYNTAGGKWIAFGGSYSGALSAWYRLKYPHLVVGSIATSAPVKAQLEFYEYFEVVQQSVGPQCAERIKNVTDLVAGLLSTPAGTQQVLQQFNACSPIESDYDTATFMSSLTDGICEIVQYNMDNNDYTPFNIDKMCEILLEGETDAEMLASYASFNAMFNEFSDSNCTWVSYAGMIEQMQNINASSPSASSRSWTWQTCVEFGFFQTGSSSDQPFSPLISLDWFLQQCNDIFGIPLIPNVAATNARYGSTGIASSNIVFPNGSIDPWHILGVLETSCSSETTSFMNGTAHCADLYPPRSTDLPELQATRALEIKLMTSWLEGSC